MMSWAWSLPKLSSNSDTVLRSLYPVPSSCCHYCCHHQTRGDFVLLGKASENSNSDSAVKPTGTGIEGWKWRKLTIGLKILLLIWSPVPSEVALMSWNPLPGPLLPWLPRVLSVADADSCQHGSGDACLCSRKRTRLFLVTFGRPKLYTLGYQKLRLLQSPSCGVEE